MADAPNYPSCIKIPNTKQNMSATVPKFDMKEALAINNELILLANQQFGAGKWSHSITNQTLDFVESFMGKYVCGCVTFIKVQLSDGTFHEDMGYCYAEGTTKGLSIHQARTGSLTDAFKKVLICFGESVERGVLKILKKYQKGIQKVDSQSSIASIPSEVPEPCAQSTPLHSSCNPAVRKTGEKKEKTETERKLASPNQQDIPAEQNIVKLKSICNEEEQAVFQGNKVRSKSPNSEIGQISLLPIRARSKSPNNIPQPAQTITSPKPVTKNENTDKCQTAVEHNGASYMKESTADAAKLDQDKKALTEEEVQRLERKRKQMEKQAEYKRQMKEKMLHKLSDNKKPNPKY